MNTQRPIKLLKSWRGQAIGYVYQDMPAGAAQTLVARGYAEYLDEQVQRAPVDRMVRTGARVTKQKARA